MTAFILDLPLLQAFDDGSTKLRADYSIDCDVAEHKSHRVLAIIMAMVYPIGSLATFSAELWNHRDLLYPHQIRGRSKDDNTIAQQAKRANMPTIQPFGILHDACEKDRVERVNDRVQIYVSSKEPGSKPSAVVFFTNILQNVFPGGVSSGHVLTTVTNVSRRTITKTEPSRGIQIFVHHKSFHTRR